MRHLQSSASVCSVDDKDVGVDVVSTFRSLLSADPNLSTAIGAIRTLMLVLEKCLAGTLQELVVVLKHATETMTNKVDCSSTSVVSGGELFLRFITLASKALEESDFEKARGIMLKRGEAFLTKLMEARPKIVKLAAPFLKDGSKILIHSKSKCVLMALKDAAEANKRIKVYVTESSFDGSGKRMKAELDKLGIPTTLVLDSSVGYIMSRVDFVLVGAEGVVESGGVVNKIGTYTISLVAKELNKPVYVMCESFKFVRLYPLGQNDLPNEFKYNASTLETTKNLEDEHPIVDYTPPSLINLLFTDLGILTPSAVSDELIKLYL